MGEEKNELWGLKRLEGTAKSNEQEANLLVSIQFSKRNSWGWPVDTGERHLQQSLAGHYSEGSGQQVGVSSGARIEQLG